MDVTHVERSEDSQRTNHTQQNLLKETPQGTKVSQILDQDFG